MVAMDALKLLGSSRVIWIDDHFEQDSADKLAALLGEHIETSRRCGLLQFEAIFVRIDEGDPDAITDLIDILSALSPPERYAIRLKFDVENNRHAQSESQSADFSTEQIDEVCRQLNIASEDRWPFEGAEAKLVGLCMAGDADVSYIIDLHDAYGATLNTRGLDLLKALHQGSSKGTAFILTHEANEANEAAREKELRDTISAGESDRAPFCVIAKQRLEGDPLGNVVSTGLKVAIKRAGLLRSLHQVLVSAKDEVNRAFENAKNSLLQIAPEQLDEYVVSRAYKEGVSELHVVERALTVSMSESFRKFFAIDPNVQQNAERLRALNSIQLSHPDKVPDPLLQEFRKKELWESSELVNGSFSPLACGDIFKFDPEEATSDTDCMFMLLVQPCDVMLRPTKGRATETGFFVSLKPLPSVASSSEDSAHGNPETDRNMMLPFELDHRRWRCDFRKTTPVSLSILDLATLQQDGRVRFESNQSLPKSLLPGQELTGKRLIVKLTDAMKAKRKNVGNGSSTSVDTRCQLALSEKGSFKQIAHGLYVPAAATNDSNVAQTERFTWRIIRIGRVRMPYAAAFLSNYLSVMGRAAFDLDYLKESIETAPVPNEQIVEHGTLLTEATRIAVA